MSCVAAVVFKRLPLYEVLSLLRALPRSMLQSGGNFSLLGPVKLHLRRPYILDLQTAQDRLPNNTPDKPRKFQEVTPIECDSHNRGNDRAV